MNRNKKLLKQAVTVGLCTAMAASTLMPAYAASTSVMKDENVYVTLEQDGSVSGIYVVNEFSSESGGVISDYGDYTSVKNLTDLSEIIMEDGKISAEMSKGKFYYQGNLDSAELPWDISIQYFINGEKINPDELAGKSGDLKIVIQTKQNLESKESFFEHYLLQATVVLNTEKCSDIQAKGATVGNVGVNRQLVYTILPGEEKEIEITAKVQEFEMDGITFQGVPLSLSISEGMLDDLDLSNQTRELIDAVAQLDDGVGELKKGTEAAADGGSQLANAISELAEGVGELKSGANVLAQGTSELSSGTKELQNGVSQYLDGVDSFVAGVEQYVAGVDMLAQGSKLLAPLESLPLVDAAIVQIYQAVAVGNEQQGIPSLSAGAQSLSDGLHMLSEQVQLLENNTDAEKLQEWMNALGQIQGMIVQLSETLEEISAAISGSADMIATVEASHQAVLEGLNRQVDTANSNITDSVENVNAQIENAISAVQAAVENGSLDKETAEQTIASLNESKIGQEAISVIQMPQEDTGVLEIINTLKAISENLKSAATELDGAAQQLELVAEGIELNLSSTGDSNGIAQLSQVLLAACEGADGLKEGVDAVGQALKQLSQNTSSFGEVKEGIAALNAGFDELCKNNSLLLDGGKQLVDTKEELNAGMSALTSGTDELNSGVGEFVDGISTLHHGVSLLDDNTETLTSGLTELDEGTGKLKEGTQEFRGQTDGMDEKIQEEMEKLLDEMTGDDFEPVSFTSDYNTNIGLVQFAITADGIKISEEIEEVEPEKEEGFIERLKKLFW